MNAGAAVAVACALVLAACGTAERSYAGAGATPGATPPADLPDAVRLEGPAEDLTHEWWVALRAGRLWIRPNRDTTGRDEPWRPLPPDGFARHDARPLDGPPPALVRLSADGDNLVAVGDDGLVYYRKFSTGEWISDWGLPPAGESLLLSFAPRALAMSHRGPLAGGYEDIDGNEHPVTAGVTTLYALAPEGDWIGYADPWLPAHFRRRVCLPERGRLRAAAMSASASTLFVMDATGHSYTRLADYDSLGDNPVLGYSYVRAKRGFDEERTLPPEDWVEQPLVPGRATARVTILQTGKGNAARELRVEGADATGRGGYWSKAIRGAAWTFVATEAHVSGPWLANAAAPDRALGPGPVLGPLRSHRVDGRIEEPEGAAGIAPGVRLELRDWDPDCPPVTIRLAVGGDAVDLTLHLRAPDRDGAGRVVAAKGMLLVPRLERPPPGLAPVLAALFGTRDARIALRVVVAYAPGAGAVPARVALRGDAPGPFGALRLAFGAE